MAQEPSSSSSSNPDVPKAQGTASSSSLKMARTAQPEAGGSAITLETSETLFTVAAGLNACGYDADLADSEPVRSAVRADLAAAVADAPAARDSQDKLCQFLHEHELNDKARELAQYVSLALYVGPPPKLAPAADETEMPPDALQVVKMLPLLRTFAAETNLHSIWLKHRAEYEADTDRVHDSITQMVLGTNVYLKTPVSSYDGRRLLILMEPMLSPNAPNARIYANNYVLVTSPTAAGAIRIEQIRHLYLHYEIEPLVYARAQSMIRLTPLLKAVKDAPLDYVYKSDIVALVTECLIKAIEARTMSVGFAPPVKPTGTKARAELARYDEESTSYERRAEQVRRKQVELDMRQGWVLVDSFYNQLLAMEHDAGGLQERIGDMVYGMDIQREQHHDEQIQFLPEGSGEFVKRTPRMPTGLLLAERKMLEGDLDGAESIADKALADPRQDHAEAMFVKARVQLLEGDPEDSTKGLHDVLATSKKPGTIAWAHVYLGRLYDTKSPAERAQALVEYKAALAIPGVQPDARHAAETGLRSPFVVPKVTHREEEPLDPTGKAEKQAYRPEAPQ